MLMIAVNSLITTCLQQVPAQPHELYTRMEHKRVKYGASATAQLFVALFFFFFAALIIPAPHYALITCVTLLPLQQNLMICCASWVFLAQTSDFPALPRLLMKHIHVVGLHLFFFFLPNEDELVKLPPRRKKLRHFSRRRDSLSPTFPGSTGLYSFIDLAP